MIRQVILGAVLMMGALECQARIGETEAESQQRYGKPVNETIANVMPILDGAVHHTYLYQGWHIRAAFAGGKTVRMHYFKRAAPMGIKEDEAQAIRDGEALGGRWSEVMVFKWYDTIFSRAWVNTNRCIAYFSGIGSMLFVVDSPAAQAFIQAKKEADEQKRKATIPKF